MKEDAIIQRVMDRFPEFEYGPPGTEKQIAAAEQALGHQLPAILRAAYQRFSWCAGPLNTPFLATLQLEGDGSIVGMTKILHTCFPRIDLSGYVCFGCNIGQDLLAVPWEGPPAFIAYEGHMGPTRTELGQDICEVIRADVAEYEENRKLFDKL